MLVKPFCADTRYATWKFVCILFISFLHANPGYGTKQRVFVAVQPSACGWAIYDLCFADRRPLEGLYNKVACGRSGKNSLF